MGDKITKEQEKMIEDEVNSICDEVFEKSGNTMREFFNKIDELTEKGIKFGTRITEQGDWAIDIYENEDTDNA